MKKSQSLPHLGFHKVSQKESWVNFTNLTVMVTGIHPQLSCRHETEDMLHSFWETSRPSQVPILGQLTDYKVPCSTSYEADQSAAFGMSSHNVAEFLSILQFLSSPL
jgi:hypothetical protein